MGREENGTERKRIEWKGREGKRVEGIEKETIDENGEQR